MQVLQNLQSYVCGSVLNQSEQLLFSVALDRDIGFFDTVNPCLIESRQNQKQSRVENLEKIRKSGQRPQSDDPVGDM